ncbi:MAG TPA: hypothetical protein VMW64_07555 [Dehalococcoidia bacterium]|nr:hypothetical protein [Dehalococcoidia bacterium]
MEQKTSHPILVCNKCGTTYLDNKDMEFAEKQAAAWAESCRREGREPVGLVPCPSMTCGGELVVKGKEVHS